MSSEIDHADQIELDPPARALTPSERKILKVWADPAFYGETDQACIEAAGVARDTYFKAKQNPELQGERQRICHAMLQHSLRGAYGAMAATAALPGREGFQDRRLLMEMAGEYTPKKQLEADVRTSKAPAEVPEPTNYAEWKAAKRMDRAFPTTGGNGSNGNGNRVTKALADE